MIVRQNGKTVTWDKAKALLLKEFIDSRGVDDEKRITLVKKIMKEYLIKGS